jgi:hypothetical protein
MALSLLTMLAGHKAFVTGQISGSLVIHVSHSSQVHKRLGGLDGKKEGKIGIQAGCRHEIPSPDLLSRPIKRTIERPNNRFGHL